MLLLISMNLVYKLYQSIDRYSQLSELVLLLNNFLFCYRENTKNNMATQIFWILLVLIAVAQVEQPLFISSAAELSDTPPENRQEWLHPVIFEPQNKIQLTRSTYQVTTFLDFAPFVNGFNNVQNYIKNFKKDIHDPAYFSMIRHKSTNPRASPLLDEQDLAAFMQSAYCLHSPYACMTRLKIDRFLMEVNYLEDLFDVVYQKFLNAIDHIDYHPAKCPCYKSK